MIEFKGKFGIVTGGTRGIGKAIAERLLEHGAQVLVTGSKLRNTEEIRREFNSDKVDFYQCNFANKRSLMSFVDHLKTIKRIDVLINNAGINIVNNISNVLDSDYEEIMDVNLKAPFFLLREVAKLMVPQKEGRIVNITSIWSKVAREGRSAYSASKWGLSGLTKSAAIDLASDNILVNSVAPGFTLTELTKNTNTQEELNNLESKIPMKRLALPVEIANLVLFLSSELNTYITGQNITIDGGYTSI